MVNEYISSKSRKKRIFFGIIILIIIISIISLGINYYFDKPGLEEEAIEEEVINKTQDIAYGLQNDVVYKALLTECLEDLNKRKYIRAYVGAVSEKQISICDFELEEYRAECRDEYYLYTTLMENVNHCNNIEDEFFEKFCLSLYESENRCDEAPNEQNTIICEVAFGTPQEKCDTIEDTEIKNYCKSIYYLIQATKQNNIALCDELQIKDYRGICQGFFGKGLTEEEKEAYCISKREELWIEGLGEQ